MSGVLLDPRTGKPESGGELLTAQGIPVTLAKNLENGWVPANKDALLPESVREYLDKSRLEKELRDRGVLEGFYAPERKNSLQSWQECIYTIIADGTAVTAASATIMLPDFTLPANYFVPGRTMRYVIAGRYSTVITTPGTITQSLRYGGVGGTALATSAAYTPDTAAASTNLTFWTEYWLVCRSAGASGTIMCIGRTFLGDYITTSGATIATAVSQEVIPATAPATATINTTTANALSPVWTQSVATGTMTVHLAFLESLS